ncbi:MAG TPA: hypothetical protein VN815_11365 [Steroidobacteraceae bacterium]|nr:hypothetical protein [Steroidobacteraceae bacterium]
MHKLSGRVGLRPLARDWKMNNWLHNLPVVWMALVIFGATYLVAAATYVMVAMLAVGERARSFKAVSPAMLPPLCIIFGLFVAFTAAQVWGDIERANLAVNREASALRSVVVFAASFPGEPEARLRALVHDYIEKAAIQEWQTMSQQTATLGITPRSLAEALQLTLALAPVSQGQQIAQREIAAALENTLDARRQRIIVSRSQVNWVKWTCLFVQAICALLAIALVHTGERLASAIALGIFASGVAACVLLIASHDRPFIGQMSVGPDPLLQVIPDAGAAARDDL